MTTIRIFVIGAGACAFPPHSVGDAAACDASAATGDAGPLHPATYPAAKVKQTSPTTPAATLVQRRTRSSDPLVCG
jgi:hypothetical protein